jgi:hypothetical protein
MKTRITTGIAVLGAVAIITCARLLAAEPSVGAKYEYVTIRWDGRENTHIVRSGGKVEFIGSELRKAPKPNGADERSFYMNLALNGLSKEGFELVAMTNDDMILKRAR